MTHAIGRFASEQPADIKKVVTAMNYVSCVGLTLSMISLLCLGVSGPGYRLGLWGYKTGISFVKYSGFISLAAVLVCVVGLALWYWEAASEGRTYALIGLVVGGCVLALMLKWKHNLNSVPYIHDISTDTENPPLFVAILPLRIQADNPAAYGGAELAKQQHIGYPDLKSGSMSIPPAKAFPLALQAANAMGWKIVDSDPESLRIEATDTTCWFGFKDDVVVRLTPLPTGSRIDVRSVSRVGKSDLGTNARRIKAYLARMK